MRRKVLLEAVCVCTMAATIAILPYYHVSWQAHGSAVGVTPTRPRLTAPLKRKSDDTGGAVLQKVKIGGMSVVEKAMARAFYPKSISEAIARARARADARAPRRRAACRVQCAGALSRRSAGSTTTV